MNTETKRHIDGARQVLVGVVPNPTSQIDQITNALIYKFMDDMDQAAIKAGGDPSFFTGNLERYAWTRLMDARMGNQERMNLYSEALLKFSESPQLPVLFRGIFKSAFLPYRSPEVLGLFLKEIDFFDYSHPEELGNAYEYLLSIMSSQGDAGQFRTPRHIIDFIVDVVNPTTNDKVLDPACGTGGFLVSAYNQILEQHDGKDDPGKKEKSLTPDQRRNLMNNFEGYDVDPGMVRIAQVNMYLHQFKNPKIVQYDTLSMEERWGDKFDVILANPPFMSPKGGVKTHSKFSIESSRSEVLFVDYIMNHLRPKGRAGIIVPEGIIFQSANAYKELRKKLVEDGLFSVVSLPSGVFNPYSGVKTSILLFNNEIAKRSADILFVKIENDGLSLGAQRREIIGSNLPEAVNILKNYKEYILKGEIKIPFIKFISKPPVSDKKIMSVYGNFTVVAKDKISADGQYNLSMDRYREELFPKNNEWPMVELGEITEILNGYAFKSEKYTNNGIRVIRITNVQKGEIIDDNPKFYAAASSKEIEKFLLAKNDLLISLTGNVGRVGLLQSDLLPAGLNQRVGCIRMNDENKILIKYLFHVLNTEVFEDNCIKASSGVAQKNLSTEWLKKYQIPLPPLEIQERIVAELDGYQKIINGAREVVENWKPKIDIDPEWEKVKLPEISENHDNKRKPVTKSDRSAGKYPYYGASGIVDYVEDYIFDGDFLLISEDGANLLARSTDIAFSISGKNWVNNHAHILKFQNFETQKFIETYINQIDISEFVTGMAQPKLNQQALNKIEIPLPSLAIQKKIVEKIEAERALVESNKKLIEIYEQKTKEAIAKLWRK